MKISLAPIAYFWSKDRVTAFYDEICKTPVDIVYLGETVCSKRRELRLGDWRNIAGRLAAAGKEVVLSTLTLLEAESELAGLQKIIDTGVYPIEANDMAAVQLASARGEFIIGPHINIYNNESLLLLHELGAKRWVVPVEIGRETLRQLQTGRPPGLETEVFAYGRVPLAFSARCFSARAHNRCKDECNFVCRDDTEGLLLATQDQQPFLIINGIQVQSAAVQNLIPFVADFKDLNIDILRIAPQATGMMEIVTLLRDVVDDRLAAAAAAGRLAPWQEYGSCAGYWQHEPGMQAAAAGSGHAMPTNDRQL